MAGYVATGRITRVHPRVAGSRPGQASDVTVGHASSDLLDERQPGVATTIPRIAELWKKAGEEWAQTTFYLFDPNSWR